MGGRKFWCSPDSLALGAQVLLALGGSNGVLCFIPGGRGLGGTIGTIIPRMPAGRKRKFRISCTFTVSPLPPRQCVTALQRGCGEPTGSSRPQSVPAAVLGPLSQVFCLPAVAGLQELRYRPRAG